jgi:hypothetical protein
MQISERNFRMKSIVGKVSALATILLLASGVPLVAQRSTGLTLPIPGFSGTATIDGFVNQRGQVVAIGSVANSTHTSFALVSWPVNFIPKSGRQAAYRCPAPKVAQLRPIAWSPDRQNGARLVPVQTSSSCGVVTINLGETDVNLEGVDVHLPAISFSVSGQSGTPLGGIVCSLNSLITSAGGIVGAVGNVVNLLNTLLGALTGSLGSLTGGAGGGLPGLP